MILTEKQTIIKTRNRWRPALFALSLLLAIAGFITLLRSGFLNTPNNIIPTQPSVKINQLDKNSLTGLDTTASDTTSWYDGITDPYQMTSAGQNALWLMLTSPSGTYLGTLYPIDMKFSSARLLAPNSQQVKIYSNGAISYVQPTPSELRVAASSTEITLYKPVANNVVSSYYFDPSSKETYVLETTAAGQQNIIVVTPKLQIINLVTNLNWPTSDIVFLNNISKDLLLTNGSTCSNLNTVSHKLVQVSSCDIAYPYNINQDKIWTNYTNTANEQLTGEVYQINDKGTTIPLFQLSLSSLAKDVVKNGQIYIYKRYQQLNNNGQWLSQYQGVFSYNGTNEVEIYPVQPSETEPQLNILGNNLYVISHSLNTSDDRLISINLSDLTQQSISLSECMGVKCSFKFISNLGQL